MYNVTALIHTGHRDRIIPALRDVVRDVSGALVEPTLPGVRNGGDILMHLPLADQTSWPLLREPLDDVLSGPGVSHVDSAHYRGEPRQTGRGSNGSVFRALFLRVAPNTSANMVSRFEADLISMPRYVSTIAAFQLSHVDRAYGSSPWTHVFSQRFTDVDGINGPYLLHPIHWAYVDRWFDPECPDYIVRDRVCHSFCAVTTTD